MCKLKWLISYDFNLVPWSKQHTKRGTQHHTLTKMKEN